MNLERQFRINLIATSILSITYPLSPISLLEVRFSNLTSVSTNHVLIKLLFSVGIAVSLTCHQIEGEYLIQNDTCKILGAKYQSCWQYSFSSVCSYFETLIFSFPFTLLNFIYLLWCGSKCKTFGAKPKWCFSQNSNTQLKTGWQILNFSLCLIRAFYPC